MMTDNEILRAIKYERIKIKPFNIKKLGPVSYDLTTFIEKSGKLMSRLVSLEEFKLPRDIVGILAPRSRVSLRGIFTSFSPIVDPGYRGHVIFLVYRPEPPHLIINMMDLFQIMFFRVGEVKVAYNERKSSTAMDRRGF